MRFIKAILSAGFVFASLANADRPTGVPNSNSPTTVNTEADKATTENQTSDRTTSFWMEKKLEYTQSILRGLAAGDFDTIKENGEQMRLLSKVEGFVRRRHPHYRTQLHTFERVCTKIVQNAERENLEGVTLAFNQLTISCVSCHQTLRATENDNAHTQGNEP